MAVYATLIDTAWNAASFCLELQSLLRHEGPEVDRSRQEVQGNEIGSRLSEGRRPRAGQHLVARTGYDKKDLLCGVEPASLFRISDGGDSWEMVAGISNHEHARKWQPGNGGLCMHTIYRDGKRIHLGISTGGHYLSEDGGNTFKASNQGVGAGFTPDPVSRIWPMRAQDRRPHRRTRPALHAEPRRLGRMERARRAAARTSACCAATTTAKRGDRSPRGCRPISASRSSCIRTTPTPSTSCRSRPRREHLPGGAPAVWRSENGGGSWKRLARGLPKKESYFTVQRDAMEIDDLKSPALYFGTTTGQLWMGRDGGEEWSCLFDSLPPIHCVKVAAGAKLPATAAD